VRFSVLGTPCVPIDREILQDRAQPSVRLVLQLVVQAVAVAVDRDHERAQLLDPQLDQAIMRNQVGPRHRDNVLDGVRQQRAAAAEEREIDATNVLHGLRAVLAPSAAVEGATTAACLKSALRWRT